MHTNTQIYTQTRAACVHTRSTITSRRPNRQYRTVRALSLLTSNRIKTKQQQQQQKKASHYRQTNQKRRIIVSQGNIANLKSNIIIIIIIIIVNVCFLNLFKEQNNKVYTFVLYMLSKWFRNRGVN